MPNEPRSWLIRRWAAPAALAVLVAAAITTVGVATGGGPRAVTDFRGVHFILTVGATDSPERPWLEVHRTDRTGPLTDLLPRPESAGDAREIIAAPDGRFVVAASRGDRCESRLYRFGLTADGEVTDLEPVGGGTVPALVAGLAMSPDGDRLAYTTAPCAGGSRKRPAADPPRATLTVLDTGNGHRRTWGAAGPSVVGEIVWARDGR